VRSLPLRAAPALVLVFALGACSPSIYTDARYASGQASLVTRELPGEGWSKGEVLASMGAPGEVLPQPDGDVFLYRLRRVDQRIWNVDTRYVAPVGMPLYVDREGESFDRTLFVLFDREGVVTHTAVSDR
jgi:hypothetical protein